MTAQALDRAKMSAFAGRMIGVVNGGMLALMTSIGRQTGLFETMATLPPSTSQVIADAAGLNERYVREWLGAMVTGAIVEYEAEREVYWLPAEHAALMTKSAGARNLARFTQYTPMLAEIEADIIACFQNGGGVPYDKFPRFQKLMAESSGLRFESLLLGNILPLTGMVEALEKGIDVLDIGCGQGRAIIMMAQAFPNSRFTGYDFSEQGIAQAQGNASEKGLANTQFIVKDLTAMVEEAQYDLITAFDVIHDQAQPAAVLEAVARALRPGAVYLMMDIKASSNLHENMAHPLGPFLYTISTMHCMTVSLAQGGAGLGTVWGRQKALEMLAAVGFEDVQVNELEADAINYYYVTRKMPVI
jgi:ubiquinone/menaquinone biosynthesis C-methylase UbiE